MTRWWTLVALMASLGGAGCETREDRFMGQPPEETPLRARSG